MTDQSHETPPMTQGEVYMPVRERERNLNMMSIRTQSRQSQFQGTPNIKALEKTDYKFGQLKYL